MGTMARLGQERVYTMRELSQDTSGVIAAIVESGRRALLTKRGQFLAVIQPLDPGVIESQVASVIADYLGDGSEAGGNAFDSKFVAAMVGIDARQFDPVGWWMPLRNHARCNRVTVRML